MKKLVLTLVAISALNCAKSQEINYGIKTGINISSIASTEEGEDNDELKSSLGLNIGGFISLPIPNLLDMNIETGIYYSQTGAKLELNKNQYSKMRLNEINIPLKLKYNVYENLSLNTGGYVSYRLSTITKTYYKDREVEKINVDKKLINPLDIGLSLGGEYVFNNKFIVFANYNYGLTDIASKEGRDIPGKATERTFQLGVGYKF